MANASYSLWLLTEAATARYALITLLENKDRLLFVEAPALRAEYMEKVGYFEEKVLEAELDVTLLRRKAELIQAALNRREPIDMEEIERQTEALRKQLTDKEEAKDMSLKAVPALTREEREELQKMYRMIIEHFHPSVNTDITQTQRMLFDKALEAYRRQSHESMRLIFDMLFDKEASSLPPEAVMGKADANAKARQAAGALSVDYALARQLYDFFAPMETDAVLLRANEQYMKQLEMQDAEISGIQRRFPFTAREMLQNPQKTEEYALDLRARLRQSELDKAELTGRIEKLTGAAQK